MESYGTLEAAHSPTTRGLGKDLERAFVPAVKVFGLAGSGYVMAEYGSRVLLPNVSPLWQALVQSAAGLVGMVVAERYRADVVAKMALGAGISGVVKALSHILSKVEVSGP